MPLKRVFNVVGVSRVCLHRRNVRQLAASTSTGLGPTDKQSWHHLRPAVQQVNKYTKLNWHSLIIHKTYIFLSIMNDYLYIAFLFRFYRTLHRLTTFIHSILPKYVHFTYHIVHMNLLLDVTLLVQKNNSFLHDNSHQRCPYACFIYIIHETVPGQNNWTSNIRYGFTISPPHNNKS